MFTERELEYLEGILNEEIHSCCSSGHDVDGEYISSLRDILKRLGLKEYYKFDDWRE